jgi:hypothetical protein
MTITARVREGRLVLDEPTTLPEGTQVALLPLDPGDWLDDAERAALYTALRASEDRRQSISREHLPAAAPLSTSQQLIHDATSIFFMKYRADPGG